MTLNAPCHFCNYNGPNYWSAGSHSKLCPWHNCASEERRRDWLLIHRAILQSTRSDWLAVFVLLEQHLKTLPVPLDITSINH